MAYVRPSYEGRFNKFMAYVLNHPSELTRSADLVDYLNVSKSSIAEWWKLLPDRIGGSISSIPGKGFIWTPGGKDPEPKDEQKTEAKAEVIFREETKTVDRKEKNGVKPGCVYEYKTQSGSREYLFIVASFKTHVLCIPIVREGSFSDPGPNAYYVTLPVSGDPFYMDLTRLTTRLFKYITDFVCDLGDDVLLDVMIELEDILGLGSKNGADLVQKKDDQIIDLAKRLDLEQKARVKAEDEARRALANSNGDSKALDEAQLKIDDLEDSVRSGNKKIEELAKALHAKSEAAQSKNKEIEKLAKTVHDLQEVIFAKNEIIEKLKADNASLRLQINSAGSGMTDKKAELELRVLRAKLDIYEKELFGGEA